MWTGIERGITKSVGNVKALTAAKYLIQVQNLMGDVVLSSKGSMPVGGNLPLGVP